MPHFTLLKKIFFIPLLLFYLSLSAQQGFNDSIALSRNKLTEKAMIVLGSWGAANMISGFIIAGQYQGEAKYIWQMNAYWGLVNAGIAALGYINARKAMAKKYGYAENVAAQVSMEKLYALNLGLDFAYIATGFYLREKGVNTVNQKSHDQFKGYGTSIIIQGGFLMLYDAIVLSLHHKNSVRLNKKLKNLELAAGPNGFGLSYTF
jgi:hypothetical protein